MFWLEWSCWRFLGFCPTWRSMVRMPLVELLAVIGDLGDSFCNVIACFYRNGNNAKWCLVQLLRGGVSYPSVLKWWWPYCFWQPFPQSTRCGFEARLRLYSMCTHTFFYNLFSFLFLIFFAVFCCIFCVIWSLWVVYCSNMSFSSVIWWTLHW